MSAIMFKAMGDPKGQPRPRAFVRGDHAAVYDPGTAEGWKSCIAEAAKPFIPASPITCPVMLTIVFTLRRPKYHFGTGKNVSVLKQSAPKYCPSKPDIDNYAKSVMDCLTRLGFWLDDAQVVDLHAAKQYQDDVNPSPGAGITIIPLSGEGHPNHAP